MTIRLVALMSVVLLLSLGAFGLLIDHYQGQVMGEVARTASDVGRAMLLSLEPAPLEGEAGPANHATALEWHERFKPRGSEAGDPPDASPRRIVITSFVHSTSDEAPGAEPGLGRPVRTFERRIVEGADRAVQFVAESPAKTECPELGAAVISEDFLIDVADIRTESDVRGGLVLKIPGFTPGPQFEAQPAADGRPTPLDDPVMLARDEIRLPIEVGHYETLFDRVRGRSIALFLGVFLVGTVLSAGLASHFTRPIRRLDAGIRQLAAGDLEVSVPAEGRDEIARLGRAFNEMAGRLRANRDREREMVRREKLTALGRLAAGVAHDVRNPLHSIGLTLQHLRETARPEQTELAAEFDRSLEVIRDEIRRLDQLVVNFLGFAKSERRERTRVDLAELLRETASLVGKEAEWRGVAIELAIEPSVPAVTGDAEALRSAILNLVLNSLEAMPDGGGLTLRLAGEPGKVVLEVSDTGEGIAPEHREHVFDFAYTTRQSGNGLGLAMVHHCVVEEHGGRIWLDSKPGEGTSVRIALPATTEGDR